MNSSVAEAAINTTGGAKVLLWVVPDTKVVPK